VHARRLAEMVELSGIVTSPLVRAVQTAELLATACGLDDVVVRAELAPQWYARGKIAKLAREMGAGYALVGHNPSLHEAAGDLLGLEEFPGTLKKGSAVALRPNGKGFAFEWLSTVDRPSVKRSL